MRTGSATPGRPARAPRPGGHRGGGVRGAGAIRAAGPGWGEPLLRAVRCALPLRGPAGREGGLQSLRNAEGRADGSSRCAGHHRAAAAGGGGAQAAAEFEQQLIGIVSHDLRNPLDAILLARQRCCAARGPGRAHAARPWRASSRQRRAGHRHDARPAGLHPGAAGRRHPAAAPAAGPARAGARRWWRRCSWRHPERALRGAAPGRRARARGTRTGWRRCSATWWPTR